MADDASIANGPTTLVAASAISPPCDYRVPGFLARMPRVVRDVLESEDLSAIQIRADGCR